MTRWIGLIVLALFGWGSAAAFALDDELLLRLDVLDPSLNAVLQSYQSLWLILSVLALLGAIGWAGRRTARSTARRLPAPMIVPLVGAVLAMGTIFALEPLGLAHSYEALHDPSRQPVAEADFAPNEWIISVERNGDEVIYPLDLLERHLAINDRVGDEPVLVTWCFSCNSPMAYRSTASDQALTFDVVGIHEVDAILEDRQTRTWWDEGTGEAVGGPLRGAALARVPTTMVQWQHWQGDPERARVAVGTDDPSLAMTASDSE